MISHIRLIAAGAALAAVAGGLWWGNARAYDRGEAAAQAVCAERAAAAQAGVDAVKDRHATIARDLSAAEAEIDRLLEDLQDEAREAGNAVCDFDDRSLQRLNDAAGLSGPD